MDENISFDTSALQDGIPGTGFILMPETTKTRKGKSQPWDTQQQCSRHWILNNKGIDPSEMGGGWVTLGLLQLAYCFDKISGLQHKEGTRRAWLVLGWGPGAECLGRPRWLKFAGQSLGGQRLCRANPKGCKHSSWRTQQSEGSTHIRKSTWRKQAHRTRSHACSHQPDWKTHTSCGVGRILRKVLPR